MECEQRITKVPLLFSFYEVKLSLIKFQSVRTVLFTNITYAGTQLIKNVNCLLIFSIIYKNLFLYPIKKTVSIDVTARA